MVVIPIVGCGEAYQEDPVRLPTRSVAVVASTVKVHPTAGLEFPRGSSLWIDPYLEAGEKVTVVGDDQSNFEGMRPVTVNVVRDRRPKGDDVIVLRSYLRKSPPR